MPLPPPPLEVDRPHRQASLHVVHLWNQLRIEKAAQEFAQPLARRKRHVGAGDLLKRRVKQTQTRGSYRSSSAAQYTRPGGIDDSQRRVAPFGCVHKEAESRHFFHKRHACLIDDRAGGYVYLNEDPGPSHAAAAAPSGERTSSGHDSVSHIGSTFSHSREFSGFPPSQFEVVLGHGTDPHQVEGHRTAIRKLESEVHLSVSTAVDKDEFRDQPDDIAELAISHLEQIGNLLSLDGRSGEEQHKSKERGATERGEAHHSKINESPVNFNDSLARDLRFVGTRTRNPEPGILVDCTTGPTE